MAAVYDAAVTKITVENGIGDLQLNAPEIARAAKPGTFVHIKCGAENLLRRPISICDVNVEDGTVRVLFQIKGAGTTYLSLRQPGDILNVQGPLGHGFDVSAAGEHPLLIGGGVGVPPLLLLAKRLSVPCDAVLAFRSAAHVLLMREFADIARTSVSTDDGSLGFSGYAASCAEHLMEINGNSTTMIYACGPIPMLKSVKTLAKRHNIPCEISLEERMGCGVGACRVCACKVASESDGIDYKRVCREGPVFRAEEVLFDA